jgi:protein required for attachment to host cells
MKKIWVMVADEAIVRVMSKSDIPGGPLDAVQALTDPAAHGKDETFHHDAHGRRSASPAQGPGASQPVVSAGESGRHIEAEQFARRVAEFLQGALNEGRFDELHIAAAPRFLGLLRKAFPAEVGKRVVQSFDKDWTQADDQDLAARFFPRKSAA